MRFPSQLHRSSFDHAIQQLRDGRAGESGYGRRVALLLTIPTFDDPVARDVRRDASGEMYAVRTVWQRALDAPSSRVWRDALVSGTGDVFGVEVGRHRPPTLRSVRLELETRIVDAMLAKLASATITCRPHHPEPPLDATVIELTLGEELHETRYRWSDAAPAGWEPLATFASQLIRLVDDPAAVVAR
jgi:hypothetical protein